MFVRSQVFRRDGPRRKTWGTQYTFLAKMRLRLASCRGCGRRRRSGGRWQWRQGLAFGDYGYFLKDDWGDRLVIAVAGNAGDGFDYFHACVVALAEERVVHVERGVGLLGDEGLAADRIRGGVG